MTNEKATIIEHVNQYGKQLLRFIRGKVATDEDAEDILQDVWYQYMNLDEVSAIESISGWLYRVAHQYHKMSDEERAKFRNEFHRCYGGNTQPNPNQ